MVLIKEMDASGLVFTTYASSRKGRELAAVPRASVVFYWRETMQQLKVEGMVERLLADGTWRGERLQP
jgi:pyridoxamine 5'-phosphate oxidase